MRADASLPRSAFAKLSQLASGPIARGAVATLFYRIVNVAIGLVITVLLAAQLSVEGFGLVAFGLTSAMTMAMAARLGADSLLVRMTSTFIERKNWSALNGAARFGAWLAAGASASLAAVIILLTQTIENAGLRNALILASLIAPAVAMNAIAHALLRGMMRIERAYIPEFIIVQIITLFSLGVLAALGALTYKTVLLVYLGAWAIAATTGWRWVARYWPAEAKLAAPATKVKKWTGASALVMVAGLGEFAVGKIEVFALAALADPDAVGQFALALKFALIATFPAFAVSSALAPAIAGLKAANNVRAVQRRITLGARTAFFGAVAAGGAVALGAFVGFPLIDIAYAEAAPLALILVLGFIVQAAMGRPLDAFLMLGSLRIAAILSAGAVAIGAALAFLLTAHYGAAGAAAAAALACSLSSVLFALAAHKTLGVRTDIFASLIKEH